MLAPEEARQSIGRAVAFASRSAAATTSTIVRSTPCVAAFEHHVHHRPGRPVPRPRIPTALPLGAWSWTGDSLVSGFGCDDGRLSVSDVTAR